MPLRWYQQEAIDSLYSYFQHNTGNPVIAMPTGTGKSHVIGDFSKGALRAFPQTRIMMLTHVKELIEQNARKLFESWPTAPMGIYSAGLKQRETNLPIIYGGTASVFKCVEAFGHRDLLIIDECHLLSDNADSMLQQIIGRLRAINPKLKVVGLSATIYRLGLGLITENGIFDRVAYDLCQMDKFNRLLAEGWLSPLVPKRTVTELNVSNVALQNGDFALGALQKAVDVDAITYAAVREMMALANDRVSWLIFCSGVEHSEHVAQCLNYLGVSAAPVHSRLPDELRNETIEAFKEGRLRAVTNNNVLTTGFDHPPLDFIGVLRPTMSTSLWVQMLGRGTRPYGGYGASDAVPGFPTPKRNCLVADFARNTPRLGPINDPVLPRKRGQGGGDAPVRICEACGTYQHARRTFCECCGVPFEQNTKLMAQAGTEELIRSELPQVEHFNVERVLYHKHVGRGSGLPMLKVGYVSGLRMFSEYVCLEHPSENYASKKARDWWRQRHWSDPPAEVDEALTLTDELRIPKMIRVWVNTKYPEVLGCEF